MVQVDLGSGRAADQFGQLFAEELGLVLEVAPAHEQQVLQAYTDAGLPARVIGTVTADAEISISVNEAQQISGGGISWCLPAWPATQGSCRPAPQPRSDRSMSFSRSTWQNCGSLLVEAFFDSQQFAATKVYFVP